MTLHLLDTYDVIAALTVTDGTDTVTIDDIDKVERGYTSASCPRLLLLPGDDEGGLDLTLIGIDTSSAIVWNIPALYLQAPAEEGLGWRQYAVKVATFVENFLQALIDAKADFCANGTMLIGMSPRRGVYEYPSGSGQWYYGAMFTIRVKDFTRIT
jgi:hypothetical protein